MSICDSSHSDQSDTSGVSSSGFGHTRTASLSSGCGNVSSNKMSLSPELRRTREASYLPVGRSHIPSSSTPNDMSRNTANHMSCPDLENMVAKAGGLGAGSGANLSGGIPNRALEILNRSSSVGNNNSPAQSSPMVT